MKRDMELVRRILLEVEATGDDPRGWAIMNISDRDPIEVSYHVKLLHEAGLLEGFNLSTNTGFHWAARSRTWAGHEFLDAARNDTVWNRAMTKLKGQAASVPFEVVKAVVIQTCKDMVGIQ